MSLITTTDELDAFCAGLATAEFVTVDTEFMRERTYYSKLCLVQLGGPDSAAALDPLAEGIDLAPLFKLMDNPKVLKVFHAARQDIEIFVNLTGRIPRPLFDTQVAAMVCGFGESASYETLARKLAGAKIDKTSRFTDWSRRPLTEAQTEYALCDVTHLRKVYEKLAAKLEKTGRTSWVDEEMAVLTSLETYQTDPYAVWKKMKLRSDKPRSRAILRELAAWREIEAQQSNIPRARMIKDNSLLEIAAHAPRSIEELDRTRGLPSGFAQSRHGEAMLAAIERGLSCPLEECPPSDDKRIPLPSGAGAVYDLLKVLLHQISDEHGVATKLIASSHDLEMLAREDAPEIKTLTGWRLELFGKQALSLKKGELALAIKNKKIKTIEV
jgi:ribonuclease D